MTRKMLAALLAGVFVVACGKSEPPSNKARANAPLKIPAPDSGGKGLSGDPNEALKERLARQEAASKLFDKAKPEPPPKPEPAPRAAPEPKAAAATPAKPEPAKAEPPKVETPPPAAEKKAEPAPAPPPRTDVAAAKPSAPAPAASTVRVISQVEPEFPREALQGGHEKGNVRVRMTLDGSGNVTKVDIVEANPRRVFDRAVVRALSLWRFNEGSSGRIVETEIEFRR